MSAPNAWLTQHFKLASTRARNLSPPRSLARWQVSSFAAETHALAERLKSQGPGTLGVALPAGLELLRTFQQV